MATASLAARTIQPATLQPETGQAGRGQNEGSLCVCVSMLTHAHSCTQAYLTVCAPHGTGVMGGCEVPNVSAGSSAETASALNH